MPKTKAPKRKATKPKLRPKQAKFVREYTDPKGESFGNGAKSAIASGYSENSAKEIASQNLTKVAISGEIKRAMAKLGGSVEFGIKRLIEGMSAEDTKVFLDSKNGQITYSKPLIAHSERRQATEMFFRLQGAFPTNQVIERRELLSIQQNILVVPPPQAPEEKPAVEAIIRVLDD